MTTPKPKAAAARAWQRMLSGRRLDLLEPSAANIEIDDIAHGLARVARWNGQTKGAHAFSVAQHSLLVTSIVEREYPSYDRSSRLAALLHDAPEYVIGDLISPFKAAIGLDYKAFERRLLDAIHARFGIAASSPEVEKAIKHADRIAAYYEATELAGFAGDEAEKFFGKPPISCPAASISPMLEPLPADAAEQKFLELFQTLERC